MSGSNPNKKQQVAHAYAPEILVVPGEMASIYFFSCRKCLNGVHLTNAANKTDAIRAMRIYHGWGGGKTGWICPDCKS